MYSPLTLGPPSLGTVNVFCNDTFLGGAALGGCSVSEVAGRIMAGPGRAPGELGFMIDLSCNESKSELGESPGDSPPGEGRSYGETLVILLAPTESPADEYDPEVR